MNAKKTKLTEVITYSISPDHPTTNKGKALKEIGDFKYLGHG